MNTSGNDIPFRFTLLRASHAINLLAASSAIGFGAFAVLAPSEWLAFTGVVVGVGLLAFTLPRVWLAPTLGAFAVLQFYTPLPGTTFVLRGALLFVAFVVLRVLATEAIAWRAWMLPASVFVLSALISAFGAPNQYTALRGVYDWLAVFLTVFGASRLITSHRTRTHVISALIVLGVVESLGGLTQAALGVERVLAWLNTPAVALFFQPDLLRERLNALNFNWLVFDRVLPFGNFINAIDYAIFLAAILVLALAWLFTAPTTRQQILLLASVSVMSLALLLTFKGSGLLAWLGGISVIALARASHLSRRDVVLSLGLGIGALIFAAPLADALAQRVWFLLQREAGAMFTTGRLAIWGELLGVWTQHVGFGVGLNNAAMFVSPMPSLNGGAFTLVTPSAESAYVAALVETGALGLGALVALFMLALRRAWQRWCTLHHAFDLGLLAATVALLVGNLTVAGLTTDQNGMVLGLLLGMIFAERDTPIGN